MSRLLAALAMVALATFIVSPDVNGQEVPLNVEGRVVNGTEDGGSIAGLAVTLHQEGSVEHDHLETIAEGDGRFRFDDVRYDPNVVYGVSVRYNDALYGTDLDLARGAPLELVVTVYETVGTPEVVSVTSTTVMFASADPVTQTVSALEILTIANDSDTAYSPGSDSPMDLLRFSLPPGALDLEVDTRLPGVDVVQVDRGFAILGTVPPGEHEVVYTYRFPYAESESGFTKSFPFGAKRVSVLAPYEVLDLAGEDGAEAENFVIGEREYQLLKMTDLDRGTSLSVSLGNLPISSTVDRLLRWADGVPLQYVAPAALALLMASLITYGVWVRPRRRAVESGDLPTVQQMIEDLEQGFASGSVNEDDYRRRRRLLEQRIAELPKG